MAVKDRTSAVGFWFAFGQVCFPCQLSHSFGQSELCLNVGRLFQLVCLWEFPGFCASICRGVNSGYTRVHSEVMLITSYSTHSVLFLGSTGFLRKL